MATQSKLTRPTAKSDRSHPKAHRRFSTVLMTTIVALVTVSVVVVLIVLNRYLGERVDDEFKKKLRAQKGQIEILIRNRISEIQKGLEDFSSDNTIRVTMMLDAKSKLTERITQSYPSNNGVYPLIQRKGSPSIFPEQYSGISKESILHAFLARPWGDIFQEGSKPRLLWLFSRTIMGTVGNMGTAAVVYDMVQDTQLKKSIQMAVDGDMVLSYADTLLSLTTGLSIPLDPNRMETVDENSQVFTFIGDLVLSRISGNRHLYFVSPSEGLQTERRKVTLLMGIISALILGVSMLISAFLAGKMVRPLKEMTRKAIQISEGYETPLIFDKKFSYWEFDQLSQAFNTMLLNLKDAEERSRYQELLENVDDAVYILDEKGSILEANTAAYTSLGYSREQFYDLRLDRIIPPKDAQIIIRQPALSSNDSPSKKLVIETLHQKKDGGVIPVEIHSHPIIYIGKSVILNVARDITKRIEAEKALRSSEERYRSVVENSNDGILILNLNLEILYANRVMTRLLGYKPIELEGQSFISIFHEDSVLSAKNITRATGTHEKNENAHNHYQVIRKSGEIRTITIGTYSFADSSGENKWVAQLTDITDQLQSEKEKKQLEAQLNHAQKMEAMGTMAGSIAHDFNNLIMGIQGPLEILRLQHQPGQPSYKHLDAINKTVKSATTLTRQLLGFSRKGKSEVRPVNLNTLVEESTNMFIRSRKEIKLQLQFAEQIWPVKADRGQLEQVLVNLYVNAWQAMPKGGKLDIHTENVYLEDTFCKPFEVPGGEYVNIRISDTGLGMSQEIMDKIFDPFFTTKESGKGTGLGLASAYGIIRNHKGIIMVESEVGKGTVFNIYLPSSASEKSEWLKGTGAK